MQAGVELRVAVLDATGGAVGQQDADRPETLARRLRILAL